MNTKFLSIVLCAALFGAVVGYCISVIRMKDNLAQGGSSIYIADFRTVDAEDGSPINTRMSPGEVMIAQINSGVQTSFVSSEYCMHSEVDNGHWRLVWKDTAGTGRTIELSAEGYETANLPTEMIREIRGGSNIFVGGILGSEILKMNKTQPHTAPNPSGAVR